MTRVVLLTRLILLRNKWLILLLMVWPLMIALVIRYAGAGMNADDITALLNQESLYGIAMVAFAGSALLGAEERSSRIQIVLSRAVSRGEYLAALLMAAWLPLLLYVGGFCAAGWIFGSGMSYSGPMHLWPTITVLAARQLCLGLVVAAASVLSSVLLPTAFAAVATVIVAAAVEYAANAVKPGLWILPAASAIAAALCYAVATTLFVTQDLDVNGD